ncbi:hypothetical protein ACJJTC_007102 [Scirpophaga incertulas]
MIPKFLLINPAAMALAWCVLATDRVTVSEQRGEHGVSSQLSVSAAQRRDSGVYRCRAENAYGRDELLLYLAVQELPEAPRGLRASARGARRASLSWRRGFDGNARVRRYRLQLRAVGAAPPAQRPDWAAAPTRDVSVETLATRQEATEDDSEITLEYVVEGLRPATTYALRLAAVNDIGESDYSETVIVQTLEEAPSEPPQNVEVQATAPAELLVKWQPPPQESWNGEILGANAAPSAAPQRVRCAAVAAQAQAQAQALRVWWEPPPPAHRGGLLLGYDLLYEVEDDIDGQMEIRNVGGLEIVVPALRRGANHSVAVRARSAAGSGPTALARCSAPPSVPGPPADIKALPNSEDSIIVSWLEPTQPNGKITHYIVYTRPQRTGERVELRVAGDAGRDHHATIRGLSEYQLYEFWVTAVNEAGEGEASAVVAAKTDAREVDRSLSDNYTCTVRNAYGSARATWHLTVVPRPTSPRLRVVRAAPAALRVEWDPPTHRSSGYTLEYAPADTNTWTSLQLGGDVTSYDVSDLACGRSYRLRLSSYSPRGRSAPGETIVAATVGGPPKAPPEKTLISSNSTCVRLNLVTWDSNGCPASPLEVSLRPVRALAAAWRSQLAAPGAPLAVCGLAPATWHHLKVTATSQAGSTLATYYFATLTEEGERISAPAQFPASGAGGEGGEGGAGGAGGAALLAAAAAVSALALLAALLLWTRSHSSGCLRKGYEPGEVSEEEDKSLEKRDNRRNCQQVYTSSPIKHPIKKKEQQEMYEISPYATFSMSGGSTTTGGDGGATASTLRTFGRAEPELGAAPLHRPLADEYTLSRAMTLMVRRSESDSESSGSPCAECTSSASYRLPVALAKEESRRVAAEASAEAEAEAAAAARTPAQRPRVDKRRRARRPHPPHHPPRYQQRHEQERRDFTIHV